MKNSIFGVLQRVGRSFMLPIAILPVAGLFLGIGGSFTNITTLEAYNLMGVMGPDTVIFAILSVMSQAGDVIFANLPIIFAMGVAIGMAKAEKEVAALSGVIAFFIMNATIGAMIAINGGGAALPDGSITTTLGITTLQMGVFGGIIVGLGVAALHNKFYKIELPAAISFFGGSRFVPIISAITYLVVGIAMYFAWPPVQNVMYALGDVVRNSGYIGTFFYGLIERSLIPFGLHHVFYIPFWQTALGGTMTVCGNVVEGAQNIFFAELACAETTKFTVEATRFMTGKFPFMMFGLPGAALAMYHTAKPSKKQVAYGLLFSAALTAFLTGITEPLEFTFLFVAPALYAVHAVLAGFSFMLMHVLNIAIGQTFSGGFIDYVLFGVLQGQAKTNFLYLIPVGVAYFGIYYVLFKAMILKFNLKTPGREDDDEETKLFTRADVNAKNADGTEMSATDATSAAILAALGGKENMVDVDACATRLRLTVKDVSLVNDAALKATGANGIIKSGQGVQVIYGPRVSVVKTNLVEFMDKN
ncbi:MAG: PTS transporter subunit EIIC [Erysipelotrichaceae bacterium]